MCRFVAYLGKHAVRIDDIVKRPHNSLLDQAREAQESMPRMNADGHGLAWYDFSIDEEPGIYRSIQPAWNDRNFSSLISKIRSTCFIGHVRGALIGEVALHNSQPFTHKSLAMAHNGTIFSMPKIRRRVHQLLLDDIYEGIRGSTDSEVFFALFLQNMINLDLPHSARAFADAYQLSLHQIHAIERSLDIDELARINVVITDGTEMFSARYISHVKEKSWSLYYSQGTDLKSDNGSIMKSPFKRNDICIITSERLTNNDQEWRTLPTNHMLLIDKARNITIEPIDVSPEPHHLF